MAAHLPRRADRFGPHVGPALRRRWVLAPGDIGPSLSALVVIALVVSAVLSGCSTTPADTPPSTGTGALATGEAPTDVPEKWPFEADPNSAYGLPKSVGLAPEVKPETRVLTAAEAAALTGVEILNRAACVGRATVEPKCRYRIGLGSIPADVTPGRVLVGGVSPSAPAGFLVRVDSIEGNTVLATEAGLGDALAQGEFRAERSFTAKDVTSSELAPGVTRMPGPTAGSNTTAGANKGTSVAVGPEQAGGVLGEGMDFHYAVDVEHAPGVHIVGEIHFSAGCGVDGGLTYWHGIPDGAWFDAGCHVRQGPVSISP